MPVRTSAVDRHKEKLLLAGAIAVAALFAARAFLGEREPETLPVSPRVKAPPPDAAVLRADKLVAEGSYWDEGSRFVFVEPEKARIFTPVALDVPTVEVPKIVMPLPEPGPLLQFSDALPRLDGTMPVVKPAETEAGGAGEGGGL